MRFCFALIYPSPMCTFFLCRSDFLFLLHFYRIISLNSKLEISDFYLSTLYMFYFTFCLLPEDWREKSDVIRKFDPFCITCFGHLASFDIYSLFLTLCVLCDMLRCRFFCFFNPAKCSLRFLDVWFSVCHLFWIILSHYYFKYFFWFFLFTIFFLFWYSLYDETSLSYLNSLKKFSLRLNGPYFLISLYALWFLLLKTRHLNLPMQ